MCYQNVQSSKEKTGRFMKSNFKIDTSKYNGCSVEFIHNGLMIVSYYLKPKEKEFCIILSKTKEIIARSKTIKESKEIIEDLMNMSDIWNLTHKDFQNMSPEELRVRQKESDEIFNYLREIEPELYKNKLKAGLREMF